MQNEHVTVPNNVTYLASVRVNNSIPELILGPNGQEIEDCVVTLQQQGKNGLWYNTDKVDGRYRKASWRLAIMPSCHVAIYRMQDKRTEKLLNDHLEHQDRLERVQMLLEDVRMAKENIRKLRATNKVLVVAVLASSIAIMLSIISRNL